MTLIDKCEKCGRRGRYGKSESEEICAKCEIQTGENNPKEGSEKNANQAN